jgi:hypothetical protein
VIGCSGGGLVILYYQPTTTVQLFNQSVLDLILPISPRSSLLVVDFLFLASYSNPAQVYDAGAYRNNTGNTGKSISLESSSNSYPNEAYPYNTKPVITYDDGQNQAIPYNPQAGAYGNLAIPRHAVLAHLSI